MKNGRAPKQRERGHTEQQPTKEGTRMRPIVVQERTPVRLVKPFVQLLWEAYHPKPEATR